jgi:sphingomyelin phosphodiesterase
MDRYQNVVRFGLFGHSHDETISIIKSISGNQENIGINFISGSLTSYTDRNPSFTVIDIDEEFMVPINYKTYYYSIEKANLEGKITWEILHDFTNFYGLKDLRPDELAGLS